VAGLLIHDGTSPVHLFYGKRAHWKAAKYALYRQNHPNKVKNTPLGDRHQYIINRMDDTKKTAKRYILSRYMQRFVTTHMGNTEMVMLPVAVTAFDDCMGDQNSKAGAAQEEQNFRHALRTYFTKRRKGDDVLAQYSEPSEEDMTHFNTFLNVDNDDKPKWRQQFLTSWLPPGLRHYDRLLKFARAAETETATAMVTAAKGSYFDRATADSMNTRILQGKITHKDILDQLNDRTLRVLTPAAVRTQVDFLWKRTLRLHSVGKLEGWLTQINEQVQKIATKTKNDEAYLTSQIPASCVITTSTSSGSTFSPAKVRYELLRLGIMKWKPCYTPTFRDWVSKTLWHSKGTHQRPRPASWICTKAKLPFAAPVDESHYEQLADFITTTVRDHINGDGVLLPGTANDPPHGDKTPDSDQPSDPKALQVALPKINKPCKYWGQGRCKKGDRCNWLHDKNKKGKDRGGDGSKARNDDSKGNDRDDYPISAKHFKALKESGICRVYYLYGHCNGRCMDAPHKKHLKGWTSPKWPTRTKKRTRGFRPAAHDRGGGGAHSDASSDDASSDDKDSDAAKPSKAKVRAAEEGIANFQRKRDQRREKNRKSFEANLVAEILARRKATTAKEKARKQPSAINLSSPAAHAVYGEIDDSDSEQSSSEEVSSDDGERKLTAREAAIQQDKDTFERAMADYDRDYASAYSSSSSTKKKKQKKLTKRKGKKKKVSFRQRKKKRRKKS